MSTKPRALARRAAQALTAAAVVTGGVVVAASPAYAVVPTITAVFVAGTPNNKVVTAGSTVLITGTGFAGMTDNAAAPACSITPVAFPAVGSGCSQVRFLGGATTAGYTLATRYTVMSDTTIYATVPTIAASDGTTAGAPAAGTGLVKVQVVNTIGAGASSLVSASTTSDVFYRHALTATLASSTVTANPNGGGTIAVNVAGVAALTTVTFPQEKISAYFVSTVDGSPTVTAIPVAPITVPPATIIDTNTVNVVIPPGSPSGNPVGVMLVHDGIIGTADEDSLTYPALITKLESCTTDISAWITTPTAVLPVTCTGPASVSATAVTASVKVTGKGFTGADGDDDWNFGGTGTVDDDCVVVSDTLAFCHLEIDTIPDPAVAAVTFVPLDPDGAGDLEAPVLVPTLGSILIYNSLV